ncbi:hypothetical protein B0I37DRAFT_414946 [Chaetomium sp. MPI-CAGE-AT-0009]|nr:hypothetical protein B0I37DRAFT_414946 [Chaetomium sp. MPI-CAGE-AT-0009]
MDKSNRQTKITSPRSSPALRTTRQPSPTINQTTNKTNPKSSPASRVNRQPSPATTSQTTNKTNPQTKTTTPRPSPAPIPTNRHPLLPNPPTTVQQAVQLKVAKLGRSRRGLECTAELDVLMDRLRYMLPDRDSDPNIKGRDPGEVRSFWEGVRTGVTVGDEEIWGEEGWDTGGSGLGVWDGRSDVRVYNCAKARTGPLTRKEAVGLKVDRLPYRGLGLYQRLSNHATPESRLPPSLIGA